MRIASKRGSVDRVRASRDGHEFHEAWTARKATQLLWPDSDLTAIAVEGLSPKDQEGASAQTVEIADVVLYFGHGTTFEQAARTTFAQFKYSIVDKDEDFRATNAKKTIRKFAETYREFERKYGAKAVKNKLEFQLVTNQPISNALLQAIDALASDAPRKGDVERQAKQFQTASGLSGKRLAAFASKFELIGQIGSLPQAKNQLASLFVDWSATNDPIATARLGELRNLVREKAGSAGTNRNLIIRTDVLAALQIGDPRDLLPCERAVVAVGKILEREQTPVAISHISTMSRPLLVHASGGVGKTVFLDTLATKIGSSHEVVFFDCFGGGAYRSPEDARHLPKRGLIHIANTLAFRGLCDPMLPNSPDVQTLLRTFRKRLSQCVDTLARMVPGRQLAIFIDAIDNADIAARQRSEECFPIILLEALHTEPIAGVKLIVSCRTERKPHTHAEYDEFELHPFTKEETASFLRARLTSAAQVEINVAQARSGGNPRILDYLLNTGRGLLDPSEIDKRIELDDLIQERISHALGTALERGYAETDLESFLAGLAVLPPPVPLDEYAEAHQIEVSAIESFASDLYPLLERTNQGIMFRDEPTETLVHKRYGSSLGALHRVASSLFARQGVSAYAAQALPWLLHKLDDGEGLLALAFDNRTPSSITSTVGKRNVRYARLKAAAHHAASKRNYNDLVRLLLELSTVAAVDQRGADYILNHPDLVVAAQDIDARRRLFETKTPWPGARHTRLAIVNTLSGDFDEAYRHAQLGGEWIEHYIRTSHYDRHAAGPEQADIAAIPFLLISQGCGAAAARYLSRWLDWYAYEVCEAVFIYSQLGETIRSEPQRLVDGFICDLSSIGGLAATLSFQELRPSKRKEVTVRLARCCRKRRKLSASDTIDQDRHYRLEDGLRKSAAIALSQGLSSEALGISLRAPHRRPGLWSFRGIFSNRDVFPFIFRAALRAATKKEAIHEKHLLPTELLSVCSRIGKHFMGAEFLRVSKERLAKCVPIEGNHQERTVRPQRLSNQDRRSAQRFLDYQMGPLLALTSAFSAALGASPRRLDKAFIELIKTWEATSQKRDPYRPGDTDDFFRLLGFDIALFTLWSYSALKPLAVKRFLAAVHRLGATAHDLIRIVAILAQRKSLHALAGEEATAARAAIEREDEVNYRASLLGALGRAMLPASIDESSLYFRDGLEQMDAIGSGDYQFTNELLLFASQVHGNELNERDFHTLTNICELNMGEEPEKFPWGAYGSGLSKVAGLRGLAKLSRWDDRARIALDNTLLPYLTGLVNDGKIDSADALALNRLARPVEYWFAGTKEFAQAMREQAGSDPLLTAELISQFQDNNPDDATEDTLRTLSSIAEEALGSSSEISTRIAASCELYAKVHSVRNERANFRGSFSRRGLRRAKDHDRKNRLRLERIALDTDPTDELSLARAIDAFNNLGNMYGLKEGFFAALRAKVPYSERARYVQNIAALSNLFHYWKFAELKAARLEWQGSSASLADTYRSLAHSLITAHSDDLVDGGSVSGSKVHEISDLTGSAVSDLILEVIKVFARPDVSAPGSVWLGFATLVCPRADEGQGQLALQRLLSSETAKLADGVIDGPWVEGLYPSADRCQVFSGLIWRLLGSPCAVQRWRAAHSLRSFAKFGRWEIVDAVVAKIEGTEAGPFQASELPFFYMHARLWLLIALARMAHDYPARVARYKKVLLSFVLDDNQPHLLMRHFAAHALAACVAAGHLKLAAKQTGLLNRVDRSPYPRLERKLLSGGGPHSGGAHSTSKHSSGFVLDYDFEKGNVRSLAHVFGQPSPEVAGLISGIVRSIDSHVDHMHNKGGREPRYRQDVYGLTTRCHTYGQQLGWHALFLVAAKLLRDYPVTRDSSHDDDPWGEWFARYRLTRSDGLWLSDGTDRTPLDVVEFLLERKGKDVAITGDRSRILQLAGVHARVDRELILKGRWLSADNVRVEISSALAPRNKAAKLARRLTREIPMIVWVPCFDETEDDLLPVRSDLKEYLPWVVHPSGGTRLDEHDPYGVHCAPFRPRLAPEFVTLCSLSTDDPFGRVWKDKHGRVALRAQAWGRNTDDDRDESRNSGTRLSCDSTVLRKVLAKSDKDLLLLVRLERYEKESHNRDSAWTHSVGVARITKSLEVEYFKGRVNHTHTSRY